MYKLSIGEFFSKFAFSSSHIFHLLKCLLIEVKKPLWAQFGDISFKYHFQSVFHCLSVEVRGWGNNQSSNITLIIFYNGCLGLVWVQFKWAKSLIEFIRIVWIFHWIVLFITYIRSVKCCMWVLFLFHCILFF